MPKRSSKRNLDINQIAQRVVDLTTGEDSKSRPEKNPAAVALGRLGGLKGGKARAGKLSKKRRKEIAEAGAKARWSKKKSKE